MVRTRAARPVITVEHLPCRTNQRDQLYFYTPYGTYVVYDRDGAPSTLHLVPGHWDEDSGARPGDVGELLGTYGDYREAQRQMLSDLVRRFRAMPPDVDPRLSPRIDAEQPSPALPAPGR
jgi:hypothetical protein